MSGGMTTKMRMIRGLLSVYPRKWRAEYGEELEGLLQSQRLTVGAAGNVLLHGVRQRFREGAPEEICGVLILAWMLAGLIGNSARAFSPVLYSRFWAVEFLVLVAGGAGAVAGRMAARVTARVTARGARGRAG